MTKLYCLEGDASWRTGSLAGILCLVGWWHRAVTTHSGTLTSFHVLNADDLPGTKDIVSPVGQMLPGTYPRYPRRCWRLWVQPLTVNSNPGAKLST